ncbi:MAG: ABC transporter substrate-binding protein [Aeromicrobium sp.]
MRTKPFAAAAVAAGGALIVASCGGGGRAADAVGGCDPGITDTSIKIGSSSMQSGPAAAWKAMPQSSLAYFDEINEAGGVTMGDGKKRTIEFVSVDDAYDPARAVKNTKKLVEQDKIFGVFQGAGTTPTLAILDYTTSAGVPILFPMTGSVEFEPKVADGALLANAMLPQTSWENRILLDSIAAANPQAKIGILYPNDGLGKTGLEQMTSMVEGTDMEIVASESYEQSAATVDSQVVNLKSSGADVFVSFATGSFVTQSLKKAAEIDWTPAKYIISSSTDTESFLKPAGAEATDDLHSVAWLYDVSNPANDDRPGMKKWREFAERNSDQVNGKNAIAAAGYNNAQLLVATLEQVDGCERADLLDAAQGLTGVSTDLAVEGVGFGGGSAEYPYGITSMATMSFEDGQWVYGDVVTR